MPPALLDIHEYNGPGYRPLVDFDHWRVAVLNFSADLLPEHLTSMQRHNDTDEVFVLLAGRCILHLEVSCPETLWQTVPEADRAALQGVLASDPRPSYQHDPQRVYGMEFAGLEVHFTVDGDQLTVRDITLL